MSIFRLNYLIQDWQTSTVNYPKMNLAETIRQALSAVRSNMLRSVLTLLIIAFGITALVGILTAIDSAIFSLSDNFSRLGANSFSIQPSGQGIKGNRGGRFLPHLAR